MSPRQYNVNPNQFHPRHFWDNISLDKNLYSRISYISINFRKALFSLVKPDSIIVSNKELLKILLVGVGPIQANDFYELCRNLDRFYSVFVKGKKEKSIFQNKELCEKGFDENMYKLMLKQLSEFLAFGFDVVIPPNIKEYYYDIVESNDDVMMKRDMEQLSLSDLADNPTSRFPAMFIIDNSLYMEEGGVLDELQRGLSALFDEIQSNKTLSSVIELYIATCGNGHDEIVNFATIDRQRSILDRMNLRPYGRCLMASTINTVLDKLEKRINQMTDKDIDVTYYCPWLIILTNGRFVKDENEEKEMVRACSRINDMRENGNLQVYPIGLTNAANMDNLCRLDKNEAAILTSVNGFFKDVFWSIGMSKNSTPGGDRVRLVHKQGFQE